ncbi:MAG: DUF5808 domain-containing protein [Myxococcota bacterium]
MASPYLSAPRLASVPLQAFNVLTLVVGIGIAWATAPSIASYFAALIGYLTAVLLASLVLVSRERLPVASNHVVALRGRQRTIARMLERIVTGINLSLLIGGLGRIWASSGERADVGPILGTTGAVIGVIAIAVALGLGIPRLFALRRQLGLNDDLKGAPGYFLGGVIYFNREDPAWVVPKRNQVGSTFNFAAAKAWGFLLFLLAGYGLTFFAM